MNWKRNRPAFFLLLVGAAGAALYLQLTVQAKRFTILDQKFSFLMLPFVLFFILCAGGLAAAWTLCARIEADRFGIDPDDRLRDGSLAMIPLLLLLFSPLLLKHYLSRNDLQTRLLWLGIFTLLAVLYLKFADYSRILQDRSFFLKKWRIRFWSLPLKKRLVWMFIAAFLVYNACTLILVVQGITFSGDEPNYLLMSHSLLRDKDIDLANNFANKDYFHFYDKASNPRLTLGINGRYGKDGKLYSVNLPGISVLMLPWYELSRLVKGTLRTFILKGSLSIWAVLLGLQLYLLARDLLRRETLAFVVWIMASFNTPVLFYAIHLYPEIPIACFSVYIFRKIISATPPSTPKLVFLGLLLATFHWFGVKYYALFWPLLAVSIYYLITHHRAGKKIFLFVVFPIFSVVLFHSFIYRLYGTISPLAIYAGVLTPEQGQAAREALLSTPLRARLDAFLNYFLDQRDGLLLYAPFYAFAFLGIVEMARRARRELAALLLTALPFILVWVAVASRPGRCPQGRVLAPLVWIGALLIGYFLAFNRRRLFSLLFWGASSVGLVISTILLSHPSFLYQPTTHEYTERAGDLFIYLSNLNIFLPSVLPSFLQMSNVGYLPNYFWILAVITFIALYAVLRNRRSEASRRARPVFSTIVLLLAASALWVLFPRTAFYPVRTFTYPSQTTLGFYLFPVDKDLVVKKDAELNLYSTRSRTIRFSSKKKLDKVKLIYGAEKGRAAVDVRFFDLPLFEARTKDEKKEWIFEPPAYLPFRSLYVYEISLAFKERPSGNLAVNPYFFQIVPVRD
jgi:hypothetical protein